MPLISVIVPVYKVEQYLSRCIDSILAQTFTDFELILIDDGSPDKCGEMCESFAEKDKRIHVIHRENGGLSAARNTGIDWIFANSDSQWISFVDSDDWIHPQYLELLYRATISEKTQIGMCRYKRVSTAEGLNLESLNPEIRVIDSMTAYTHGGKAIFAYTWDKLYKKELWENVRFPSGRNWEDTTTTYKVLLTNNNVTFVDAELYFYYINPTGIVKQEWTPKKMDHFWAIEEALKDRIIKDNPKLVKLFHRQQIDALVEQIEQIKTSTVLGSKDKSRYGKMLRNDLRKAIITYRKELNLSLRYQRWYYEVAFPSAAWLFWTSKGIIRKITNGKVK